jgi:formylglycine-generating enzyme required for sulfatase activity
MDKLKWVVVAVASIVCGYFANKLGNWAGTAVAVVGTALALNMLIAGQWVTALVTVVLGTYLVFFGLRDIGLLEKKIVQKRSVTAAGSSERVVPSVAGPASERGPAEPVAPAVPDQSTPMTQTPEAELANGKIFKDCPACPQLVVIPAGQFDMGSSTAQSLPAVAGAAVAQVDPRELPQHRVAVRRFAAGRYAVTKGEFAAFVKATNYKTEAEKEGGCVAWDKGAWKHNSALQWRRAGFAQGDDHPVVCVSWNDAQAYVQWLGKTSHQNYRLLTEAEREYSTRAGSTSTFWWGETLSSDQANYDHSSTGAKSGQQAEWPRATVPVTRFAANPFGLFNVHGNVWEWVQDCRHDSYAGAPADGSAWVTECGDTRRVLRGGGWVGDPAGLRSASRAGFTPDFRFQAGGFRVARNL